MNQKNSSADMNIVIVGHVDHGKSTVIGRLLADTDSLPLGKLEQVKEKCRINSRPFEYAFLLDALKDEQLQGITIDSARAFFKTKKRKYIIIDAPGHIEFVKNMVTGASRAEAALLVVDINEGIQENTRRHSYLLSMLGINQIVVLVNKMDLVEYSEKKFYELVNQFKSLLKNLEIRTNAFIPVCALHGETIVSLSENMKWYRGKTVLEMLDAFYNPPQPVEKPLRFPVQDVYKFTKNKDNRRITVGTVETGKLSVGDDIIFFPSGKKNTIKSIEAFNGVIPKSVEAGYPVGITLKEEIFIKRGEIIAKLNEAPPKVTSKMKVNIFWMGNEPLVMEKKYVLKLSTQRTMFQIEKFNRIMNTACLDSESKQFIEKYDAANCIIKLDHPIAFDITTDIVETSRFVILDGYEISGGGIILKNISDRQSWIREKVIFRNLKWEKGSISRIKRAELYNQKSVLLMLTGNLKMKSDIKRLARGIEKDLFNRGKLVYYLGMKNVIYGMDADILDQKTDAVKDEHIRRLAEIVNLMLDLGVILIVTAVNLTNNEINMIKTSVGYESVLTCWIGPDKSATVSSDVFIKNVDPIRQTVDYIKSVLSDRGIIFKSW